MGRRYASYWNAFLLYIILGQSEASDNRAPLQILNPINSTRGIFPKEG